MISAESSTLHKSCKFRKFGSANASSSNKDLNADDWGFLGLHMIVAFPVKKLE